MAKWTDQVPQTQGYPVQEGSDQVRENCLSWLGGHLAETHWSPTSCLSPGDGILLKLVHPLAGDDVEADEAGWHNNQTV